jgi:two-component system, response regulator YesN
MFPKERDIEKICKFAFFFSNMNTIFINPMSHIKVEFSHNPVPDQLQAYIGHIHHLLDLHDSTSVHDVLFHSLPFRINYISARVYDQDNFLGQIIVGPYLYEEPTALMIQEVLFENKWSISLKHILTQYYLSLPVISIYKAETLAEFLAYNAENWSTVCSQNSKIGTISYNFQTEYAIPAEIIKQNTEQSTSEIETRYEIENELMSAVEKGDKDKAEKLFNEELSSISKIPDRIPDNPLRSRKNIALVFNTILRKAAEKGGLHSIYIHSISEKYAIQIEKATSIQQLINIQSKSIDDYCDTVKRLSLKKFNYTIRKAIEFIRTNLDQDLSLEIISKSIGSSSYELSRKFKKETGVSITDYINKQRINEAVSIMENKNLLVTDIAQMVGFNDVNYFTKVFKKIKGITPSEYRKGK